MGIFLIDGSRIRWFDWEVSPTHNINLAEALAWQKGTFDLDPPQREAARLDGRLLNAFPPGFTIISYSVLKLSAFLGGGDVFPPWLFRMLVGLPILIVPYAAFARLTGKPSRAAILTVAFLLGTPMLVMLSLCRIGGFFEVNHVLACCGLLLTAWDMLGARRMWPSIIGLAVAFWTRQLTLLYVPAIVWVCWTSSDRTRYKNVTIMLIGVAFIVGVYLSFNAAKFGSPFDTGYLRIYEGRDDPIAVRARAGLFRPAYIVGNLRFMLWEPPGVRMAGISIDRALNDFGAGILWTCPLLIAVVATARQWWKDVARRALMLCSFAVMGMLLMYHNTGWRQPGYYRFALDFLPIWIAVIAPYVWSRRGVVFVVICTAWSVWYFRFITFNNLAWVHLPD